MTDTKILRFMPDPIRLDFSWLLMLSFCLISTCVYCSTFVFDYAFVIFQKLSFCALSSVLYFVLFSAFFQKCDLLSFCVCMCVCVYVCMCVYVYVCVRHNSTQEARRELAIFWMEAKFGSKSDFRTKISRFLSVLT
jgi:hypothetical protein